MDNPWKAPQISSSCLCQPRTWAVDIFPALLQDAQLPARARADALPHLSHSKLLAILRTHNEALVSRLLHINRIAMHNTTLLVARSYNSISISGPTRLLPSSS